MFQNLRVSCFASPQSYRDTVKMTTWAFLSSREGSSRIFEALFDGTPFSVFEQCDVFLIASNAAHAQWLTDVTCMSQFDRLLRSFDYERCRSIEKILAGKDLQ